MLAADEQAPSGPRSCVWSPLRSRRGHAIWRFLSRKALVQSRRWSRLALGDRDSAASLLDRRFRASTIPSCVGTDGIDGRRDLDHRAVAWPGGAVISSLPAHALPQLVPSRSQHHGRQHLRSPIWIRKRRRPRRPRRQSLPQPADRATARPTQAVGLSPLASAPGVRSRPSRACVQLLAPRRRLGP
jgi:hypothetical protein